jgi:Na+/H+ antiporter NhaD/arsenite permease-like protein
VAYAAIALEHPIKINKGASALLGAGLLWTVYAAFAGDHSHIGNQLNESVASTAQIVFFLIGAMTIVEVIDAHNGFEVITSQIRTKKQTTLMWIVCFVTFFVSAVLDNLTTTIVMISLMKKLSGSQSDRSFYAAMIVISANAGGAWSVIGDVTTTMLWIGGQITGLFLPSLINLLLPLFDGTGHRPWLTALLGRRPTKVAAIALANKIARMAWAMMAKGEHYKQPAALAR